MLYMYSQNTVEVALRRLSLPGLKLVIVWLQYDQDIVDLLAGLKPESVTAEGGLYAAALPPPPQPPPTKSLSGFPPAADSLQVRVYAVLTCLSTCFVCIEQTWHWYPSD